MGGHCPPYSKSGGASAPPAPPVSLPLKEIVSRKRKRANACSTYLEGKSRKVHKLRCDVQVGLREGLQASTTDQPAVDSGGPSTSSGPCFICKPVLEQIKPVFLSFIRADIELGTVREFYLILENLTNFIIVILWLRMSGYGVIYLILLVTTDTVKVVLMIFWKLVRNV